MYLPHYPHAPSNGAFVTLEGHSLTCHHLPESLVDKRLTLVLGQSSFHCRLISKLKSIGFFSFSDVALLCHGWTDGWFHNNSLILKPYGKYRDSALAREDLGKTPASPTLTGSSLGTWLERQVYEEGESSVSAANTPLGSNLLEK